MKISSRNIPVALTSLFLFYFLAPAFAQPTNSQGDLGTVIEDFAKLNGGQKDMVLSSVGMPSASSFNMANLMGSLIFGSIGFITFFYGKKQSSWKPLAIGIILMVYPYFVPGTFLMYAIGLGLTVALYIFRE